MATHTDKVLKGSFVLIGATWIQRLFGIVSLLILARLLGPEDFGIVAMSFLVMSFFHAITVTGGEQYLLSRSEIDESTVNIAWTLNLIVKSGVTLLTLLTAPFAAELFHEPRIEAVLYMVAVLPIVDALSNPGLIFKERNLEYGVIAVAEIMTKVVAFSVTLYTAIVYESYWALIAGDFVGTVTFTIISYFISNHRPTPKIDGIKKQWAFSKWMLARSITGFTRAKADQFIVATFYKTSELGIYNISKELVLMPFNQISEPLSPLFLSLFTDSKNDLEQMRKSYSIKFALMFAIMLPITCGFYILREEIVVLILGAKWMGAEEFIGNLVILILTFSMTASSSAILVVLDKMKLLFTLEVITMSVMVLGQLAAKDLAILEFALVRSLLAIITFVLFFTVVTRTIKLRYGHFLVSNIPAVISCGIMIMSIMFMSQYLAGNTLLFTAVITGIVVYFCSIYTLLKIMNSYQSDLRFIYTTVNEYLLILRKKLLN